MADRRLDETDKQATLIDHLRPLLRRLLSSARWQVYRRFPNLLLSKSDKQHDLERDARENQEIRVDNEENLLVPIIWATEVFGPTEVDSFYEHVKKLGWDKNPNRTDAGPARWIAEQRLYGLGGNYNIGVVTREKDNRFFRIDYHAPLPDEVDYLQVKIHQVSNSTTCVTIGFILKHAPRTWYSEDLNTDSKTFRRAVPKSKSISILSPANQKHESIEKTRAKYRAITIAWFKEHMAGFFSNQKSGNLLPTAELITCANTTALAGLSDKQRGRQPRWLHTLLPIGMREVWASTSFPALRLTFNEFEDDSRHHAVFALKTSEVSPEKLAHYGGANTDGYTNYVSNHVNEVLAHLATQAYLTEAARIVKRSREQLRPNHSPNGVEQALKAITSFFQDAAGFPAVADDIVQRGASPIWYYECGDFVTQEWGHDRNRTYTLAEALASRMRGLAEHFSKDEASTREQFEQVASILSIKESIRAQKRMEILTVVALLVAFLSLLVALPSISEWPDDMRKWMSRVEAVAPTPSATQVPASAATAKDKH